MRVLPSYVLRTLLVAGITVAAPGSVSASPETDSNLASSELDAAAVKSRCARQFEIAQRVDMESFRDYDAETFRKIHHPDAVTMLASGTVRYGIDAIMEAMRGHFEGREAIWSWTERYRVVDGCRAAFILYETTYEIPSVGFLARALTGVTYSYHHGKWLAIADQGTRLP